MLPRPAPRRGRRGPAESEKRRGSPCSRPSAALDRVPSTTLRRLLFASAIVWSALALGGSRTARSDSPAAPSRWTAATPDARIDAAVARATTAPGHPEHAQLAAMAVVAAIADRAADGHAEDALGKLAKDPATTADARAEALLLARSLAADEGTEAGSKADHALGVVEALSVLGPFRDTGGGIDAHDGPEQKGAAFAPSGATRGAASRSRGARCRGRSPRLRACRSTCSSRRARRAARGSRRTCRSPASRRWRCGPRRRDRCASSSTASTSRVTRTCTSRSASTGSRRASRARRGTTCSRRRCAPARSTTTGMARLRVTDDAGGWPAGVTESANLAGAMRAKKPAACIRRRRRSRGRSPSLRATSTHGSMRRSCARWAVPTICRSPRAPGILAALADGGGLDADRLAMAAWIAPSGANRSAWLHTAHDKGDADTRAFVDRRLVERHLDAQLSDWAMVTLRSAGLDRAQDAEAALLEARVDASLGTDALRMRAMHRLQDVVRAHPADAPDAVLDALAALAESLAPARRGDGARGARRKRGDWGADHVRVVAATGTQADVVAAAKRAFEGSVADADDALSVAQAVARAGAHAEARALYEKLAAWAPNRAPVWAGLAEEIGASKGDPTRRRGARRRPPACPRARARGGPLPRRDSAARARRPLARRRGARRREVHRPLAGDPRAPPGRGSLEARDGEERRRRRLRSGREGRAAERERRRGHRCDRRARRGRPRAALPARFRDARGPPRLGARALRARDRDPAAHGRGALRERAGRRRAHRDPAGARAPQGRHRGVPRRGGDRERATAHPLARARRGRRRGGRFPHVDRRARGRPRRSAVLSAGLRGIADDAPPPLQRGRRRLARGPAHLRDGGQRQGRPRREQDRGRPPRGALRVGHAGQRARRAAHARR